MTLSANLYEISALLIAFAFLALIIALIPALIQMKKTIKALEDLTLESKKTVEGVNALVQRAGSQAGDLEMLLDKYKDIGNKVADIGNVVVDNIKSPIVTVISMLFGAEQGFKRFFSREHKGGGEDGKQG